MWKGKFFLGLCNNALSVYRYYSADGRMNVNDELEKLLQEAILASKILF
jgi:hypothetical protein